MSYNLKFLFIINVNFVGKVICFHSLFTNCISITLLVFIFLNSIYVIFSYIHLTLNKHTNLSGRLIRFVKCVKFNINFPQQYNIFHLFFFKDILHVFIETFQRAISESQSHI